MKVLSIDFSTSCTGYAVFVNKNLNKHGFIKQKSKSQKGSCDLQKLVDRLRYMAIQVKLLVELEKPDIIVIEEIAGSKQRIGQKTLDMGHAFMLIELESHLTKIVYYDVTGLKGWRTHLGLKLTEQDKIHNKEARSLNKKISKSSQKIPIIGPKHLSARYVNNIYNLQLNVDKNSEDADVADAIAMGSSFLKSLNNVQN